MKDLEKLKSVRICYEAINELKITLKVTFKKAELQQQEAFADAEIAKAIDTIVEGNALRRRRDATEKERDRTDVQ